MGLYQPEQAAHRDRTANVDAGCFHHEALLYSGDSGFLRGTLPFIGEALTAGEPVLVAVGEARAKLLREVLGDDAEPVRFLGVDQIGRNPARAIPAWGKFLREHASGGRPVRGIGESAWLGRSVAELEECGRHESLLNVAFEDGPQWRLLCPYDIDALEDSVIESAQLSHPWMAVDGTTQQSDAYVGPSSAPGPFEGSLPAPRGEVERHRFAADGLGAVRGAISVRAAEAHLDAEANGDLVLAINELVTNSVQYAGGHGTLDIWIEDGELLCEVRDTGRIADALAGRVPPPLDQPGGRGLWLVNHLCDLVQIRSSESGNTVRVHAHLP
jgi:anti-sigma regulatory factor (Ser/Thr protein kinase)